MCGMAGVEPAMIFHSGVFMLLSPDGAFDMLASIYPIDNQGQTLHCRSHRQFGSGFFRADSTRAIARI